MKKCVLTVVLALMFVPMQSILYTAQTPEPGRRVVRIYYGSRENLQRLNNQLDVWEVHPENGSLIALIASEKETQLRLDGYQVETVRDIQEGVQAALDPRYFYFDNYNANSNNRYMVNFLQQVNSDYSNIAELFDAGDAWQSSHGGHRRDILILRITNENPAFGAIAQKPVFVLHANIHAREVATPELAIRYILYLTSGFNGQGGYGVDPDVTWLVDWNAVYIVASANPDGHVVNEQNTNAYRRKNMDNDDGCTDPNNWGVDLNRNHNFKWGCCGGSSSSPCSEVYRGPARSSEPETSAFQDFLTVNNILQDQNGANGPNELPPAAPLTATGVLLSLHSYANEVLWPWSFSPYTAPNSEQIEKIGRKLAFYTGYAPSSTIGYDVDGDTADWAYGQLGVASFTIEVGPDLGDACSDFFPAYGCIDGIDGMKSNFWKENRPGMIYLHKIARTPYLTSYGPDAGAVQAAPNLVFREQTIGVSADIRDNRLPGDPAASIGGAEYFLDRPGVDGAGASMTPQDGSWGNSFEKAIATVSTSSLSAGRHYILVHGKTTDGNWGPFTAVFFSVQNEPGLDITLNQSSFNTGDSVIAQVFRLKNLGPPAACELKVWLGMPGASPVSVLNLGADGSFLLPTGFDHDFGPLMLFTVALASPRGNYEFSSRTVNPVTGKIQSESLNPFTIQ